MSLSLEKMHYGFAIEDLLGSGARVVQEKIFSTKHIGRVFDFILFEGQDFLNKCEDKELVEYRVRHIFDQLIFCGFSQYRNDEKIKCIELDCGWDNKKIILSVSFLVDNDMREFNPAEESQNPKAIAIKKFISDLQKVSDGIAVRTQKEYSKLQIFCFIDGEVEHAKQEAVAELHVLKKPLPGEERVPEPAEATAEETADASVAPTSLKTKKTAPTTLAEGNLEEFVESEKKNELETKQKAITGAKKIEDMDVLKAKIREKVSVEKLDDTIDDNMRVNADGEIQGSISLLLDTLKTEILPLCIGLSKEQFDLAFAELTEKIQENYSQTLQHLVKLKTIQMVSKVNHYKDQMKVMQNKIDDMKAEREEMIEKIGQSDIAEAELLRLRAAVEKDQTARTKVDKIEKEASIQTKKLVQDAEKIQMGEPARNWSKEFIKATEKERGIFQQKIREKESEFKKKELEFTSKENVLKEKIRVSEEKFKQQEFTSKKMKESLAATLSQMEKSRVGSNGKPETSDELRAKLGATEKLLGGAKENIERMQKRVDDVQRKWQEEFSTRSALQKQFSDTEKKLKDFERRKEEEKPGLNKDEDKVQIEGIRLEKDRLGKALVELKSKNNELQRKVDSLTNQLANAAPSNSSSASKQNPGSTSDPKKPQGPSDAEMKLKFERLQKIQSSTKEELEKVRKKFDETRQEEMRLKTEVQKLQADLKNAVKGIAPKSTAPKPPPPKSPLVNPKKPAPPKK